MFRDTLSTGQAIKPQAARDVSAMVGSLRERAMREVHAGDSVTTHPTRRLLRTKKQ